jgi:hypothetical protein
MFTKLNTAPRKALRAKSPKAKSISNSPGFPTAKQASAAIANLAVTLAPTPDETRRMYHDPISPALFFTFLEQWGEKLEIINECLAFGDEKQITSAWAALMVHKKWLVAAAIGRGVDPSPLSMKRPFPPTREWLNAAVAWADSAMNTTAISALQKSEGKKPPAEQAEAESTFTPRAFTDPDTKTTYRFTRPLLWQLWRVIWTGRGRLHPFDQLAERVDRWKNSSISDGAYLQGAKDLRAFWKSKKRPDIAGKITAPNGYIGYDCLD